MNLAKSVTRRLVNIFSDENLTKKASLNAIASALDYVARLVVGFFLTPYLVAGLGDFLYGVWQVLSRFFGYISAASGRANQALKFSIANIHASDDFEEKRRYVAGSVVVWVIFLPLMLVLSGLLVWLSPIWLKVPPDLTASVRMAAGLLMANLVVYTIAQLPRAVLQGENLGYKRMGLSTFLVLFGGGLTALALLLKTGIVGVAFVNLFNTLLSGLLFFLVVRSQIPWFGFAKPLLKEIKRFLSLSGWFLLWRLVMQMMTSSDIIVLGLLNSAEMVTHYSLSKYAPDMLTNLVVIIVGGITPGLGGIVGSGDMQRAKKIRGEIMSITWLVATGLGATAVIWNRSFITLWVGKEHYVGFIPNLLIMLMVMQFVILRNDAFFIDLTLNVRRKVLVGTFSVVLSIALAGFLVVIADLGVVGLCVGFIIGQSVLSVFYPLEVGRYLKVSLLEQMRGVLRPLLVTITIYAGAMFFGADILQSDWISLIFFTGITLLTAVVLAFFAGLTAQQRGRVFKRVRMVLSQNGKK